MRKEVLIEGIRRCRGGGGVRGGGRGGCRGGIDKEGVQG